MYRRLLRHLFPGDRDEHGAIIAATVVRTGRGTRLLARDLFVAVDGVDYVPGERGYRMLTAEFVMDCVLHCAEHRLVYLAVHCHRGSNRVAFSSDDLRSHERGYPALLDILNGPAVGALVFASGAIAGDLWMPDRSRRELDVCIVGSRPIRRLHAAPPAPPPDAGEGYDRQARLFGDRGQSILRSLKVGIVGLGGAGSLVNEYLSRLGVGEIVSIDPDRVEPSNLPRIVGARRSDTRPWLTDSRMLSFVRRFGERRRTAKVRVAQRVAREANPAITYRALHADVADATVAAELINCDYLFLCADTAQARLVFNALVHQYLIPGVQMGAKAQVDLATGAIVDLFTVTRPVIPGQGCLWCNGLISPARLQEEATDPDDLQRQRYVAGAGDAAPSVITLNAVAASLAVNDFLVQVTGLAVAGDLEWTRTLPRTGEVVLEEPRTDPDCRECSGAGRLGAGDSLRLPVRDQSM
jgi:molybdopterin/thiamine biosynthesis adenylyltransferase